MVRQRRGTAHSGVAGSAAELALLDGAAPMVHPATRRRGPNGTIRGGFCRPSRTGHRRGIECRAAIPAAGRRRRRNGPERRQRTVFRAPGSGRHHRHQPVHVHERYCRRGHLPSRERGSRGPACTQPVFRRDRGRSGPGARRIHGNGPHVPPPRGPVQSGQAEAGVHLSRLSKGAIMANGKFADLLKHGGFQAFLWTQFLGAFNDSFYQTIVLLHAEHVARVYIPVSLIVFNLPFLLFSGYSGHLADAVSKRRVMIGVKLFEILIVVMGLAALAVGSMPWMMLVMFLLGLHSTVFSPAKYGIVPEMWPDKDLSRANALLEMSTFVAMVLGMSVGAFLFGSWHRLGWRIGTITLLIAVTGLVTSLRITRVPASGATQPFRWNPFAEVFASTRHLMKTRALWLTVLGICYFWFLGALFKMVLPDFGAHVLHASDTRVGLLWTFLAVGVGTGNMLAGRLSGNKVELGLVPVGSILMALASFGLFAARGSYAFSVIALSLVGLGSGLFVVPLYAYVQQRAGCQEKGRIVAANNFYQTLAMLLASAGLMLLQDRMGS